MVATPVKMGVTSRGYGSNKRRSRLLLARSAAKSEVRPTSHGAPPREVLLKWMLPDGNPQETKAVVESKPVRLKIGRTPK